MSVFSVNCSGAVPTPCYPNGTVGPPPPPDPIVAFSWWKLEGGAKVISRTPPKTKVPVNISVSVATGPLPVGVLGNKLVVGHTADRVIVLEDNEDGTYALRVETTDGIAYACATVGDTGDYELIVTAKTPTQNCARFRVQVIKDPPNTIASGDHFALRSAAVGLWVSACSVTHPQGACPLKVTTPNPLEDARALFTFDALRGDQLVPPH